MSICKYPECVDNGPDGHCTDWLLGACNGPPNEPKAARIAELELELTLKPCCGDYKTCRVPCIPREDALRSRWLPIETAPKDGTYIQLGNAHGVWIGKFQQFAVSGYRFDAPWRSMMMNHWHILDKAVRHEQPTHWMPLPLAPGSDTQPDQRDPDVIEQARAALSSKEQRHV